MRRLLAIALLGAFLAQTSGSASAAGADNVNIPPLGTELASMLLSLQALLLDTPISRRTPNHTATIRSGLTNGAKSLWRRAFCFYVPMEAFKSCDAL
jgi:hypothetical protein